MRRLLLPAIALVVIAGLVALGVWQLERRVTKLALIDQVEHRLVASPVSAPGPEAWPGIGPQSAYTRVAVHGTLLRDRSTLTQAVTAFGPGFWVMTPMKTDQGFTVLINRGFVSSGFTGPAGTTPLPSHVTITGLLRVTEPKGGFLRSNDPAADRWYSRDVAAIAARRALGPVAPYFIDADAKSEPGSPRGGLTVVSFPNNHLQYALTWFAMAGLLALATVRMVLRPSRD
ncbi:SURF1 family protein [Sphingomonas sp. MMS24-J13]|uniref:SURF1 family protein n=1 Tax=Sphingomonas sp. MMS24-J13 TaxID=3238686 RepID=UPI00385120BF